MNNEEMIKRAHDRTHRNEDHKGVDWHAMYMKSQRELMEEASRWSRRVRELEYAFAEKFLRLEEQYNKALQEGFEEAYKMLEEQSQKETEDSKVI